MQTAGGVMSLTCVSDLCSPEGAVLQGRLWSYCGVFPWYLLLIGANCFCFSSFSSLSFDTTLTPHSGSLIGTQEGDQETSPPAPNKNKNKTNRHPRPGDRYAPIYQLTPERAEGSRSVSWCHECNKMTSSERMGKFKQIHETSNCLLAFASFKTPPSSPLLFLLSMCFILSALTALLRVLRETCIL